MGITNKAISRQFLNIIIRINHGQTEIVMQYGSLRSSRPLRIEPINRWINACGSSCSVSGRFWRGEHVYRVHLINVQLVTDPVIMLGQEEHICDSASGRLDKHEPHDILALACWKTWKKFRYCRKGRTIRSIISYLCFTVFNVPWTILSWVRPSWHIPIQTITFLSPKRSDSYTHWSVKRSPRLRYRR
jgi:hypothetical protein